MFRKKYLNKIIVTLVATVTLGSITPISHASYESNSQVNLVRGAGKNDYIPSAGSLLNNHARAAAAMEMKSGKFVYSKNGTKKYAIASTSKLMTLYLAIKKAQKLDQWNHKVRISNSLSRMSHDPSLGSFKLRSGSYMSVRSLYLAALIASSNSAAIALGQYVSGSNANFIKKMNHQASNWKIASQAHFVSASGLENSDLSTYGFRYGAYNDYNKVSARALTIIAQHLLASYPSIVNNAKKRYVYLNGQRMKNENELLKGGYSYHSNLNVDGLKTGYTPLAGYCLVSTSKHNGHRLILTTLHDNQGSKDQAKMIKAIYKYSDLF